MTLLNLLGQHFDGESPIGFLGTATPILLGVITAIVTVLVARKRERGETTRSITSHVIEESSKLRKDLESQIKDLREHDKEMTENYYAEREAKVKLLEEISKLRIELQELEKQVEKLQKKTDG